MKLLSNPTDGQVLDATLTMYPSRLELINGCKVISDPMTTTYGYVVDSSAKFRNSHLEVRGEGGTFFAIPGCFSIEADGSVVLIQRFGYRGLLTVGRIEEIGRLSYIDGCSSTILVHPARVGDPVLNHLRIPGGIEQSQHTHPSIRLGVIARGKGIASGRNAQDGETWEKPLQAGTAFLLDAHELHCFSTTNSSEGLDVITFHPDSECGPTDQVHPMIARTHLSNR